MIRITRQGGLATEQKEVAHHYSIGGHRVVFDTRVNTLQKFSEGHATLRYSELLGGLPDPVELSSDNAKLQYQGLAPFDQAQREIRCWIQNNNFQLDLEGKPVCRVDLDKKHIRLLSPKPFDDRLNLEIVTGPALMIALAARGVYGLHAGAILAERGAVGFIAESGVGKSTLSSSAEPDWRQLCDDIMPLEQTVDQEGYTYFLHDFPQLKLPNSVAPTRPRGETQLGALIRLNAVESREIKFSRLKKAEALLQIVRHTVAAKLFDRSMMKHHVRFAKRLSTSVPMFEVSYPRDLDRLGELRSAILETVNNCD